MGDFAKRAFRPSSVTCRDIASRSGVLSRVTPELSLLSEREDIDTVTEADATDGDATDARLTPSIPRGPPPFAGIFSNEFLEGRYAAVRSMALVLSASLTLLGKELDNDDSAGKDCCS